MIPIRRFALVLCFLLLLPACKTPASTSTEPVKRYHLTGRVISTDKRSHSVMIDGDDVPGFMGVMTMPYTVKDDSVLAKLSPGDQVSAEIVVQGDDSWLENI